MQIQIPLFDNFECDKKEIRPGMRKSKEYVSVYVNALCSFLNC